MTTAYLYDVSRLKGRLHVKYKLTLNCNFVILDRKPYDFEKGFAMIRRQTREIKHNKHNKSSRRLGSSIPGISVASVNHSKL